MSSSTDNDATVKGVHNVHVENGGVQSIWDQLLLGDTRSSFPTRIKPPNEHATAHCAASPSLLQDHYKDYSLVKSMLMYESVREEALQREGKAQREHPKSNEGWFVTLFMIRGRALGRIAMPWAIVSLHAIVYTIIQEVFYRDLIGDVDDGEEVTLLQSWEVFFSFVVNSTLAFLLVHRLNRASDRFWTARYYWGDIVAKARTLVSGPVIHGGRSEHCDHAIRWMMAYAIAIMELLRSRQVYDGDMLAGILVHSELQRLENSLNPPLYAMTKLRYHLHEAFRNTPDMPMPIALERSQTLHRLELQLNIIQDCCGGMERIKATPLPIVYVSHLRTFLIVALLLFPYVYGPRWRWTTIPLVVLAGFAWLGIEGAAEECESPFCAISANALDMDSYCIGLMGTTLEEIRNQADDEIEAAAKKK